MSGFQVYIDESGDEGFSFKGAHGGSSRWFALSAVVTRTEHDLGTVRLVDEVRALFKKSPRADLHFRHLKHQQRLPYLERIAGARLRTVTVLVHKPSLDADLYSAKGLLYNYATRLLLERVSWLCRDHRQDPTHVAKLTFSNRSNMSYEELLSYLALLKRRSETQDISIDWTAIDHQNVKILAHAKRMGLQIADAVAAGMWNAANPNGYGFTEPRYAELLKPAVYAYKGRRFGYGVKVLPSEITRGATPHPGTIWLQGEGW